MSQIMNIKIEMQNGKIVLTSEGNPIAEIIPQKSDHETLKVTELLASAAPLLEASRGLLDYFKGQKHETNYVLLERQFVDKLEELLSTFKYN